VWQASAGFLPAQSHPSGWDELSPQICRRCQWGHIVSTGWTPNNIIFVKYFQPIRAKYSTFFKTVFICRLPDLTVWVDIGMFAGIALIVSCSKYSAKSHQLSTKSHIRRGPFFGQYRALYEVSYALTPRLNYRYRVTVYCTPMKHSWTEELVQPSWAAHMVMNT
jgi:hypothetical protein